MFRPTHADERYEISVRKIGLHPPDPPDPSAAEPEERPADWRAQAMHAEDFSNVTWYGAIHHFTLAQARAVRVLWRAWLTGVPDLHQSTILAATGSVQAKLCGLFRGHPAFGTMIRQSSSFGGRVGCYRLAAPSSGDRS